MGEVRGIFNEREMICINIKWQLDIMPEEFSTCKKALCSFFIRIGSAVY